MINTNVEKTRNFLVCKQENKLAILKDPDIYNNLTSLAFFENVKLS